MPASGHRSIQYRPCLVTLKDGSTRDFVYLVNWPIFRRTWGDHHPDPGRRYLDVGEVASLQSSPSRLPAAIANRIYDAGESGMGFTIFTLEFDDGTVVAYGGGNAIDFIRYPPGMTGHNIVDVFPHHGREMNPRRLPDHVWCIFDGGAPAAK